MRLYLPNSMHLLSLTRFIIIDGECEATVDTSTASVSETSCEPDSSRYTEGNPEASTRLLSAGDAINLLAGVKVWVYNRRPGHIGILTHVNAFRFGITASRP